MTAFGFFFGVRAQKNPSAWHTFPQKTHILSLPAQIRISIWHASIYLMYFRLISAPPPPTPPAASNPPNTWLAYRGQKKKKNIGDRWFTLWNACKIIDIHLTWNRQSVVNMATVTLGTWRFLFRTAETCKGSGCRVNLTVSIMFDQNLQINECSSSSNSSLVKPTRLTYYSSLDGAERNYGPWQIYST